MSPRKPDEPVRLTRIYTRGGDAGETSLGDGSRASKLDPLVRAYGAVDELNSVLGWAQVEVKSPSLARIQNELFDVGADLSVPFVAGDGRLRTTPGGDRPARGRVRPREQRAARAEELRPAGRHRGGGAPARRARHVPPDRARGARRARRASGEPARARLPEPAQRPAVHPRARGQRGSDEPLWLPGGATMSELRSTISGVENEPLYGPDPGFDYERDLGAPGEFPFTRGVYASMYRGRLWTMRQFAGFGGGGGDERAVPLSARAWADGAVDGVRHADADGLRLGSRRGRRARWGGRGWRSTRSRTCGRCSAGSRWARCRRR